MMAQNKMEAYHGTSVKAANSIRDEQRFHESRTDGEWLGYGVYFFPYRMHAERWAKRRYKNKGTILTVQLEYKDIEMLNLDDPDQLDALNREMSHLSKIVEDSIAIKHPRENTLWKYWCLGCNLYRKLHPEIGIISYTFPQRKIGTSRFRNNERQVCVSKHEIITKVE